MRNSARNPLFDNPGMTPSRVLAVSSGKGGVGKTNVSVNLSLALAMRNKKVMLMDADLGMANLDVMLGIRSRFDLSHVISGEKTLDEIIIEGPLGIEIVPASSGIRRMAELSVSEHAGLIRAFDEISHQVEYLVIDTAAGIAESVVSFCRAAHEVIVVVCDEPASITDAYALIKVLSQDYGVKRFQVLCNMVTDNSHGRQLYAKLARVADRYLDVSLGYLGSIPWDQRLQAAVKQQVPLMQLSPNGPSGIAFQHTAERVLAMPRHDVSPGYLEFFVNQSSKHMPAVGRAG